MEREELESLKVAWWAGLVGLLKSQHLKLPAWSSVQSSCAVLHLSPSRRVGASGDL